MGEKENNTNESQDAVPEFLTEPIPKQTNSEGVKPDISPPPKPEKTVKDEKPPKEKKEKLPWLAGIVGGIAGALIITVIFLLLYKFTGLFTVNVTTYTTGEGQSITIDTSNLNSDVEAVVQIVPQSVVGVYAEGTETVSSIFRQETTTQFSATGSGFIVTSDGYIVTNEHVISGDDTKIQIYLATLTM